jgi:hypothetical protein
VSQTLSQRGRQSRSEEGECALWDAEHWVVRALRTAGRGEQAQMLTGRAPCCPSLASIQALLG